MHTPVEVFGGAAIQHAVGGVTVRGGGGAPAVTFAVGGRVEQELARRNAEFDEEVRGGGVPAGGTAPGYSARYYGGRTFVSSDDVADSVLTRAGAVAPLRESLKAAAPTARRVAEKRGYILAGIAQMEELANDPLVEPDVLAEAVADLTELAKSARGRAGAVPAVDARVDARADAPTADTRTDVDAPITPIAPIELEPPVDVRRQPAAADDPVAVRNLEARMAYHLSALEAWAVELTRRVEAARRALERAA